MDIVGSQEVWVECAEITRRQSSQAKTIAYLASRLPSDLVACLYLRAASGASQILVPVRRAGKDDLLIDPSMIKKGGRVLPTR